MNFGVIGYGYWGPNVVRNLASLEGSQVLAIAEMSPAARKRAQKAYPGIHVTADAAEVMSSTEIDAVAVITPVWTHYELTRAALENGKHVFVEKPFTSNTAQGEKLIELARKKNLCIMVDHTFLFTPAVRKIRELLEEGTLGNLYYYDSTRVNLGLFQHDINVLWDLAPHDLSIIMHVLGRMPKRVSAVGACHTRSDLADIAHLYLDFGDDLIAHIHSSWLSPVKVRQMVFGGSKRTLIYNDIEPSEKIRLYDAGVDLKENDEEGIQRTLVSYRRGDVLIPNLDLREALNAEVEHFHAAIVDQTPCSSGGEFGRNIVRTLAAADESLKSGQFVNLNE